MVEEFMRSRQRWLTMAGVLMALAGLACGTETSPVAGGAPDRELGPAKAESTFAYTGYDSTGREIVVGEIVIRADSGGLLTGVWKLEAAGTPQPMIGPQVGRGKVAGGIAGGEFFANLNPDMVDNNVFLFGTIGSAAITGRWHYSGFPGILNYGTFSAMRTR
jgi:hypothetical protein